MAQITIHIDKHQAFEEVAMTSAYLGKKRQTEQDAGSFDRVALIDANKEQLERYWTETCAVADTFFKPWLVSSSKEDVYRAVLEPSLSWPVSLKEGVEGSLLGYFVNSILSKWLLVTSPADADGYAKMAASLLQDVEIKMYHRIKPERG